MVYVETFSVQMRHAHAWQIICKYSHELLHTFMLIFCELIEGKDIVCQLSFKIGHC